MDWELFRPSRATATLFLLLLLSFLLMALRLTHTVQSLRAFLFYWASPSYEGVSTTLKAASGLGMRVGELVRAHQENVILKERIRQVSLLESYYREVQSENERLKDMLALRAALPFETIPALITGRDPQNWTAAVWVDRGTQDGVQPDSPVIALDGDAVEEGHVRSGVIGRVLECGPKASKVLLVSDPLSSIAIVVPRNGEQGLVQGHGALNATVQYLNKAAAFMIGDEVLTSGLGGIFPAGLKVGRLSKIVASSSGFLEAELEPVVSLSQVREVLVIRRPVSDSERGKGIALPSPKLPAGASK